jgi:hypothetical protein
VEVGEESVHQSEASPTEGVPEGPSEGALVDFAANCNILVEVPVSPPHQGIPQCICPLLIVSKFLSLICYTR